MYEQFIVAIDEVALDTLCPPVVSHHLPFADGANQFPGQREAPLLPAASLGGGQHSAVLALEDASRPTR
jgi:hypothetical protein